MNKRLLVFATFVALPSVAASQRTRSQADKRTELFDKDSSRQTQTLRVRDVEDQSPIKLLIDKRKDLKLTDAELSQLKDTESKLKDKNAPLLAISDNRPPAFRTTRRTSRFPPRAPHAFPARRSRRS